MVREFSDVFFKVLSGLPPKRQAKVPIDIVARPPRGDSAIFRKFCWIGSLGVAT